MLFNLLLIGSSHKFWVSLAYWCWSFSLSDGFNWYLPIHELRLSPKYESKLRSFSLASDLCIQLPIRDLQKLKAQIIKIKIIISNYLRREIKNQNRNSTNLPLPSLLGFSKCHTTIYLPKSDIDLQLPSFSFIESITKTSQSLRHMYLLHVSQVHPILSILNSLT